MQIAKGLGLGLGGGCGCGAHSGCRRASGGCGRLRSSAASGRALLDLVVLLLLAASDALILILNTLSLVLLGLGLFTTTLNIISCIFLVVDFTNVVVVWLLLFGCCIFGCWNCCCCTELVCKGVKVCILKICILSVFVYLELKSYVFLVYFSNRSTISLHNKTTGEQSSSN